MIVKLWFVESFYFGQASADIKMDSEISSRITRRNSALVHASPPGSILEGFNWKESPITAIKTTARKMNDGYVYLARLLGFHESVNCFANGSRKERRADRFHIVVHQRSS